MAVVEHNELDGRNKTQAPYAVSSLGPCILFLLGLLRGVCPWALNLTVSGLLNNFSLGYFSNHLKS